VGCKVQKFFHLRNTKLGFIWTMWDVKDDRRLSEGASRCGGFIWTMWDVKAGRERVHTECQGLVLSELCGMLRFSWIICELKTYYCFIWTMWDVKICVSFTNFFRNDMFYLNYVGCKALAQEPWKAPSPACFIWTMWDVKLIITSNSINKYHVLYELCGM